MTVTFEPLDSATRVTVVHEGFKDRSAAKRHDGWQSILANCAALLEVDTLDEYA